MLKRIARLYVCPLRSWRSLGDVIFISHECERAIARSHRVRVLPGFDHTPKTDIESFGDFGQIKTTNAIGIFYGITQ
jgi:hypothetical protein